MGTMDSATPPAFPVEIERSPADLRRKRLSLELALARASRRERAAGRLLVGGIALAGAGALVSALLLLRLALIHPTWLDVAFTVLLIVGTVPAGIFLGIYSRTLIRMLREQQGVLAQDLANIDTAPPERS